MRVGTIAVREALPPSVAHITDKQIQEALWHYYYDVAKSVGYLVTTYAPKQKAQKKDKVQAGKKVQGGLFSIVGLGVAEYGGVMDAAAGGGFVFRSNRMFEQ
jgi:hypothetical protein